MQKNSTRNNPHEISSWITSDFIDNLNLVNLILILYNLNFIATKVFINKYRPLIEEYAGVLEEIIEKPINEGNHKENIKENR